MLFSQSELCGNTNPAEIFVISNRLYSKSAERLKFENEIDTSGKLGFYFVKQIGENDLDITLIDSSFFASQLTSRKANWILFIHGDSKTFEEAAIRGIKIQRTHNINVVVFSWPTKEEGVNGSKNFKNSKQHAKKTVVQLANLIRMVKFLRESHPDFWMQHSLSLFAHSLGNYLLELLVEENLLDQPPSLIFDNIILNSAAVNQKHHKKWLENIDMQNQIFVISNRHDFNLKGVRIFTSSGKQLGEIVRPPLYENACYIDFSRSVGFRFKTGRTHTFFINSITEKSENIRFFYTEILHGRTPDFSDLNRFKPRKNINSYNILF